LQPNAVRELYELGFTRWQLDRVGLPAKEWALVGLEADRRTPGYSALSLAAGNRDFRRLPAIPGAPRLPDTIWASFAATGRGWRHLNVHVQTAGAWTESEMARNPGARANQ